MPRCGNLRRYLQEITESRRMEKISYIPPVFILIIEIVLLEHAISFGEKYVIFFTIILLIVSLIELFLIIREMHKNRVSTIYNRTLTIKLDDFITETKKTNVKEIVSQFIDRYPIYEKNRDEVYKLTCQILQTHKDEIIEKQLLLKLSAFVKGSLLDNTSDIVQEFLRKHPGYEKYKSEVYDRVYQLLGIKQKR